METISKYPAVFIDRDGVIIVEKSFLIDPLEIEFIPGSIEALRELNGRYLIIVISNQSGIARGYFGAQDVLLLHEVIDKKLGEDGVQINGWYFCPHGPDDDCECRKPRPGLITLAAEHHSIDLGRSWMVGDKTTDIAAGAAAGLQTVLVKSGYGGNEPGCLNITPSFIANDLKEAVKIISGIRTKK